MGCTKIQPKYEKRTRNWSVDKKTGERVAANCTYTQNVSDAMQKERMNLLAKKANSLQADKKKPLVVKVIPNEAWGTASSSKDRFLYEITQPSRKKTAAYEKDFSRTSRSEDFEQVMAYMTNDDELYKEFEDEVDKYLKELNKKRFKNWIRNGQIHVRNRLRNMMRNTKKAIGSFIDKGKAAIDGILEKIGFKKAVKDVEDSFKEGVKDYIDRETSKSRR